MTPVVVNLMKGILYREEKPELWEEFLRLETPVREYVKVMGLEIRLFQEEGFAYLASRESDDGETPLPKLLSRRSLSYPVSLILVLLRRRITEMDVNTGESRLIMDRNEVAEMVSAFFEMGANEVKFLKRLDAHLQKIHDLGFLRFLGEKKDKIEVKRIITAYIDAQWLSDFNDKLADYKSYGAKPGGDNV